MAGVVELSAQGRKYDTHKHRGMNFELLLQFLYQGRILPSHNFSKDRALAWGNSVVEDREEIDQFLELGGIPRLLHEFFCFTREVRKVRDC